MGFYEDPFFTGDAKYYICKDSEVIRDKLKQKFINAIVANPDIDEKYKQFVRDKSNIKIKMEWAYAVDVKCPTISVDYTYEFNYTWTKGYSGTVHDDHVSISRSIGSDTATATMTDIYIYRYMMASGLMRVSNDTKLADRAEINSVLSRRVSVENIPEEISFDKNVCDNDFYRFVYNNSYTGDIKRKLEEDRTSGTSISKYWFKKCSVDDVFITFIPVYSVYVNYENKEYGVYLVHENSEIKSSLDLGKPSSAHEEQKAYEKSIGKTFRAFLTPAYIVTIVCFLASLIYAAILDSKGLSDMYIDEGRNYALFLFFCFLATLGFSGYAALARASAKSHKKKKAAMIVFFVITSIAILVQIITFIRWINLWSMLEKISVIS